MRKEEFESTYKKPALLFSSHVETIYPALLRKVTLKTYTRERISTPDNDFLDLDWLLTNSKKLVIVSHGLEGDSHRAYIKGMVKIFTTNGYDALAWNYRGCSGEVNKQRRFYHSGATEDLHCVVQHAIEKKYEEIVLVGFSLGGNLTLKYLGEANRSAHIKRAITFSVPLHLHSSCVQISKPSNFLYATRFLVSLKKKIIEKARLRDDLDVSNIQNIKSLQAFDDRYTAVLHGYRDALDYYTQCSSLNFVEAIKTPTLIVNATNDPFLSAQCFPTDLLAKHEFVKLETPKYGGHVGFSQFTKTKHFWSEERALYFALHQS